MKVAKGASCYREVLLTSPSPTTRGNSCNKIPTNCFQQRKPNLMKTSTNPCSFVVQLKRGGGGVRGWGRGKKAVCGPSVKRRLFYSRVRKMVNFAVVRKSWLVCLKSVND